MTGALVQLPLARLLGTPRAWVPIVGWTALAVVAAIVTRQTESAHGADHALLGAYGALALPLLVYGIVAATLGGDGLARACTPLVAFGAPAARVALASIGVAIVTSAILGALLAIAVAACAHGASDPPLARDLVNSAWIGALGAAAYGAYFSFGASFGARGGGRSIALIVDWIFGAGGGVTALLFPRAHLRNLLGGAATLDMSQRGAVIALVLATALFTLLATMRARARR